MKVGCSHLRRVMLRSRFCQFVCCCASDVAGNGTEGAVQFQKSSTSLYRIGKCKQGCTRKSSEFICCNACSTSDALHSSSVIRKGRCDFGQPGFCSTESMLMPLRERIVARLAMMPGRSLTRKRR